MPTTSSPSRAPRCARRCWKSCRLRWIKHRHPPRACRPLRRPNLEVAMAVSVFDLFKIGIGPSSSHTVGPMRAARLFALRLGQEGVLPRVGRVQCDLYGSLGATGKGHGTDKAVLLGLCGHEPDRVEVDAIPGLLEAIRRDARLMLPAGPAPQGQSGHAATQAASTHAVAINESTDLIFHRRETLPLHANGMRFTAFDATGAEVLNKVYYSVGGGFVVSDEVLADGSKQKQIAPDTTVLPHPFHSGADLLALTAQLNCSIAQIMRANERHWRTDAEIDAGLLTIWR